MDLDLAKADRAGGQDQGVPCGGRDKEGPGALGPLKECWGI